MYDEALGMKVNWVVRHRHRDVGGDGLGRRADLGQPGRAALRGGDLRRTGPAGSGYRRGLFNDNDNCVVKAELEIDKDSAKELEGKKVGVPIGTAAHYGFLKQMEHFGVDVSTMEVVDMAPPDGAAAFAQGSLDMVCGWGGSLRRMKEHGNVLLTGAEKDEIGISVYDVTSVPASFAAENADVLAKFLKVTADMNAKWLTDSEEMLPVIAKDAGMSEADAADTLEGFQFPTVEAQLSDKWLGKATPEFLKGVGDFFKEQGNIPTSRDTYDGAVNTGPLAAAAKM
jgi:taurine transport system substrate-binding protein